MISTFCVITIKSQIRYIKASQLSTDSRWSRMTFVPCRVLMWAKLTSKQCQLTTWTKAAWWSAACAWSFLKTNHTGRGGWEIAMNMNGCPYEITLPHFFCTANNNVFVALVQQLTTVTTTHIRNQLAHLKPPYLRMTCLVTACLFVNIIQLSNILPESFGWVEWWASVSIPGQRCSQA